MNHLGDIGAGHVLGRYELLMPIASGGMATVWAARLRGTRGFQKIVAVKTILPQLVDDPRFDQMFLDEASLASRIRHPHVVETLDLGEQNGVLYLVMEWVDGEPLSVLLKAASKAGGMPLPIAIRIASQACAGLHAAHELRDDNDVLLGLVHRDVSPQNLLVTFDGVVKVVDFGVAKATGRVSGQTTAGQVKGKAAYMSPEQARGGQIDRRTDIFALGILLFLMTTGHHPFRGENDLQTLNNICSPEPSPSPRQMVSNYPRPLELVVAKALAKDPDQRYATANDLLRALDHALPASTRVVTDDVVADFIRKLFPSRQAQRHESLKVAQRVADERSSGRMAFQGFPVDSVAPSGFTPLSQSGVLPPGVSLTGSRSAVSAVVREASAASVAALPTMAPPSATPLPATPPPARSSRLSLAVGAVGLVALGAAGMLALGRGANPLEPMMRGLGGGASSAPSDRSSNPSGQASGSAVRAGVPAGPGLGSAGSDLEIDDAGPTGAARPRPVTRPSSPARPTSPKPSESAKTPSPTSTTFLSPVRNPGF